MTLKSCPINMKEFKKPTAKTLTTFGQRISQLDEDQIIQLSKHDNGIFNVMRGLHRQSFGTLVYDTSKENFPYYLHYVSYVNNSLVGYILELQPFLKARNELTACFAKFICQTFNVKEEDSVFNTFQDQQQSLFERLGYWTYDNELTKEFKGQKVVVGLKSHTSIIYVPFSQKVVNNQKSGQHKEQTVKSKPKDNRIYLMLNKQNGYYKIGRSNQPEVRERTLQAQEPDVKLMGSWLAPKYIEQTLHRKFKDKKIRGEWFSLSADDVDELINFLQEVADRRHKPRF